MNLSPLRSIRVICALASVVTASTIIAILYMLRPGQGGTHLNWLEMLWILFLALVAWSGIYAYLSAPLQGEQVKSGFAGISPAIAFSAVTYSAVGIVLLLIYRIIPSGGHLYRLLLVAQIAWNGVWIVGGLLLAVVRIFAAPKSTISKLS